LRSRDGIAFDAYADCRGAYSEIMFDERLEQCPQAVAAGIILVVWLEVRHRENLVAVGAPWTWMVDVLAGRGLSVDEVTFAWQGYGTTKMRVLHHVNVVALGAANHILL